MERNAAVHALVGQKVAQQAANGEVINVKRAAVDVGYGPEQTYKISNTESFQRALFWALPYELIISVQKKQLNAQFLASVRFPGIDSEEELRKIAAQADWIIHKVYYDHKDRLCAWVGKPNYDQRDKALDKIYKLAGMYAAEKMQISTPLEDMTEEQVEAELIEEGVVVQSS